MYSNVINAGKFNRAYDYLTYISVDLCFIFRAINYDEKDPFLCHSCGFCKYAKFDYVLTAKPCCAVDPIENDDDRTKTVSSINSNLEKADRLYKQLVSSKPVLEVNIFIWLKYM